MKYEKFDVNYRPGRDYRELFDIVINNKHSTTSSIGITEEGELLYIRSGLMNNSSAYWMDFECYSIDKGEYRNFLSTTKANGNLEKAIKNGNTTQEELARLEKIRIQSLYAAVLL